MVAIGATPGPAVRGCLHAKTCFPTPQLPLVHGGLVLMAGAFLSTLVGRVPRHWVVGWSLTLTGIATLAIVGVPVVDRVILADAQVTRYFSAFERGVTVVTATTLMFGALGVLTVAMGLLATALAPAPRYAPGERAARPDSRPRWTREIATVQAALGGSRRRHLASGESQLVAELAYELRGGSPEIPAHLEATGVQLLDLLSRKTRGFDVRGSVLRLLDRALTRGDATVRPYRSC
ncbi:MAG: hypothetical protein KDK70_04885 [Myxococcales bacterium]|nr:hypothetical protein [Myxococcales bacterium]